MISPETWTQLKPRQRAILTFIRNYKIANQGRSPTVREVAKGTDISSTSVAEYNISKLIEAGALGRNKKVSRAFMLAGETYSAPALPELTP